MHNRLPKSRLISLALFVLISGVIVVLGNHYKQHKLRQAHNQEYAYLANSMSDEVKTLIDEKKNATLAIAMALAQGDHLLDTLGGDLPPQTLMRQFSIKLRQETDFKNVWIQLVDASGISRARSWTDKTGDELVSIREDVRNMLSNPRIQSTISVGRFDMTFKSMVPLHRGERFVGFLEVITHFNSIARQVETKGFRVAILVDAKYRAQLTHPFSGKFVGDHYVANQGADPELLDHIAHKGLSHLIDKHTNHVVDPGLDALVINYPLFDTSGHPMANFLMFKPLNKLQTGTAETVQSSTDLLMLLAMGIIGVILYLTEIRSEGPGSGRGIAYQGLFVFAFLALALLYSGFLHWYKQGKQAEFLKIYDQQLRSQYLMVKSKYSNIAQLVFQTNLNRPVILSLVAQAYTGPEQKARARRLLHDSLIHDFEILRQHNLRQLHFHLRDNESFLRFHRPGKYGDNLTGIRSTVEWVNANHSPMEGFEEGRIYNGFRHVFPLFTVDERGERQHIGSVETSFNAYALLQELILDTTARGGFLISGRTVERKVFDQEKVNYSPSEYPGFQYDDDIRRQLDHHFKHMEGNSLSAFQRRQASKRILEGEIFTLDTQDDSALLSFIPLKNPVSQKVVATLVVQKQHPFFNNLEHNFLLLLAIGIISILLLILFLYRELSSKNRIQGLLEKTRRILDAQESIVVISNGRRLLDCNRKLLDFFGYPSLEAFLKQHDCICDRFIRNDRFFHLEKLPEGTTWVAELENNPDQEYIVAMVDARGSQHAFALSLNRFDQDYIISFLDISDTISEHFSLEEKVLRDELTGALNRNFFHNNIHRLIEESRSHGRRLGLIMFDVDHFKRINDSFGHPTGDQVLIALVETVKAGIRSEDALIRWGGEEFLLLVSTDSLRSLEHMAEHIRTRLNGVIHPRVGQVSCSFGQTLYHDPEPIELTVQRADQALYRAKNGGRNRVVSLD